MNPYARAEADYFDALDREAEERDRLWEETNRRMKSMEHLEALHDEIEWHKYLHDAMRVINSDEYDQNDRELQLASLMYELINDAEQKTQMLIKREWNK